MPKLGYDMSAGRIVGWRKSPGEMVQRGEVLLEVEGDKATVDIEAIQSGTLVAIVHEAGAEVRVGEEIAYIMTVDNQEGSP